MILLVGNLVFQYNSKDKGTWCTHQCTHPMAAIVASAMALLPRPQTSADHMNAAMKATASKPADFRV